MQAMQAAERARKSAEARAKQVKQLRTQLEEQRKKVTEAYEKVRGKLVKRDPTQLVKLPVVGEGKAAQALRAAMTKIGRPYVWGAAGPDSFDCSGLTMWAYKQVGINLPHYTGSQWNAGTQVPRAQLQPGDLVFFYSDLHHVGLYVGNGKMLHAPRTGDVVKIAPMAGTALRRRRPGRLNASRPPRTKRPTTTTPSSHPLRPAPSPRPRNPAPRPSVETPCSVRRVLRRVLAGTRKETSEPDRDHAGEPGMDRHGSTVRGGRLLQGPTCQATALLERVRDGPACVPHLVGDAAVPGGHRGVVAQMSCLRAAHTTASMGVLTSSRSQMVAAAVRNVRALSSSLRAATSAVTPVAIWASSRSSSSRQPEIVGATTCECGLFHSVLPRPW